MTQTLNTVEERHVALENAQNIIISACRRGLEATCEVAEQLRLIDKECLYEDAGCFSLAEYAKKYLVMSRQTIDRILNVAETIESLKAANLRLPHSETQIDALTPLPLEDRPRAWEKILNEPEFETIPITTTVVRRFVQKIKKTRRNRAALSPSRNGEVTQYSDEFTKALECIKRVCGTDIEEKILLGQIDGLTKEGVIKWSEQENNIVAQIGYYVRKGLTFRQAFNKESEDLSEDTTLGDLIAWARFNGDQPGHYEDQLGDATIRIDIF